MADILRRLTPRSTSEGILPSTEPEAPEPPEPTCSICLDRGWVRLDVPLGDPNFGKAMPCVCQQQELQQASRLQRYSNLGPLVRLTFSNLNPYGLTELSENHDAFAEAYKEALRFAQSPEGWLLFQGPSGCGKTHLLAAIANECIENSRLVFFLAMPDLLDHLRSTFAPSSEVSYDELFEHVKNTPVLVLDDLGAQVSTPWAQEKLAQILNHRFNSQLPTVMATRLSMEELDERLRTRFLASSWCGAFKLQMTGESPLQKMGSLERHMRERMTFQRFDVRGNNASPQQRETLEGARKAAMSFAQDSQGWLVLLGDTGCGKTHLAVAAANEIIGPGQPVPFFAVPDLLDHFRSTYAPSSPISYDQLFEFVRSTPFLVLDDLGAEATTPWAREKLYQIIVHRHNAQLATIITARELSDDPRDPIGSRLKDPTIVTVVPIDAPDFRNKRRRTPASSGLSEPGFRGPRHG